MATQNLFLKGTLNMKYPSLDGLYFIDILEKNIIHSTIKRDKIAQLVNKDMAKDIYQHKLLKSMKKCGVTFNIWHKPDENGYLTDKYDWTSLMGSDKKLLQNLPDTFTEFLPPATVDTVTKIWKVIKLTQSCLDSLPWMRKIIRQAKVKIKGLLGRNLLNFQQ